jgi:hypothetical protein
VGFLWAGNDRHCTCISVCCTSSERPTNAEILTVSLLLSIFSSGLHSLCCAWTPVGPWGLAEVVGAAAHTVAAGGSC